HVTRRRLESRATSSGARFRPTARRSAGWRWCCTGGPTSGTGETVSLSAGNDSASFSTTCAGSTIARRPRPASPGSPWWCVGGCRALGRRLREHRDCRAGVEEAALAPGGKVPERVALGPVGVLVEALSGFADLVLAGGVRVPPEHAGVVVSPVVDERPHAVLAP